MILGSASQQHQQAYKELDRSWADLRSRLGLAMSRSDKFNSFSLFVQFGLVTGQLLAEARGAGSAAPASALAEYHKMAEFFGWRFLGGPKPTTKARPPAQPLVTPQQVQSFARRIAARW
jgi:hypothetical protein